MDYGKLGDSLRLVLRLNAPVLPAVHLARLILLLVKKRGDAKVTLCADRHCCSYKLLPDELLTHLVSLLQPKKDPKH